MEGVNEDATDAQKADFLSIAQAKMPTFKEGMFGLASTGIKSFADSNANNDGFGFYGDLWTAYREWEKREFKGPFPLKFQFSKFNVANWNEQNVKNKFSDWVVVDDTWGL